MKTYIDKAKVRYRTIKSYIDGIPNQFFGDYKIPFYKSDQILIKSAVFFTIAFSFCLAILMLSLMVLIYQYVIHDHPSIIAMKISNLMGVMPPVIISSFIIMIVSAGAVKYQLNKPITADMEQWLKDFMSDFKEHETSSIPDNRYDFLNYIDLAYKERREVTSIIPA